MAVAAIAVAGTAFQMYANNKAVKAQQAAANEQAELKRQQAADVMERFELNARDLRREGEIFKSRQVSSFAKSNVDVGSGSTLLALEQTQDTITRQIELDRIEGKAQANALLRGGEYDLKAGEQARKVGKYNNYNILLQNASRAYGAS